jgi:hypothetical protein
MQDLITSLYKSKEIEEVLHRHFPADCREDIKQDLFIILINLTPGTLEEKESRGKLRQYVATIIINLKNQRYGKVAKMVGQYRQSIALKREDNGNASDMEIEGFIDWCKKAEPANEEYNDFLDRVLDRVEKIDWYYSGILKLYAKLGTVRAVSLQTKIPYESVKYAITQARKEIKAAW